MGVKVGKDEKPQLPMPRQITEVCFYALLLSSGMKGGPPPLSSLILVQRGNKITLPFPLLFYIDRN